MTITKILIVLLCFPLLLTAQTMKELERQMQEMKIEILLLKTIHEKDITSIAEARKLAADADKIHFEKLNHEAAQLKDMQATYLPRETWDEAEKNIRADLAKLNTFKDNSYGQQTIIAGVVAVVISGMFFLLSFFQKKEKSLTKTKE